MSVYVTDLLTTTWLMRTDGAATLTSPITTGLQRPVQLCDGVTSGEIKRQYDIFKSKRKLFSWFGYFWCAWTGLFKAKRAHPFGKFREGLFFKRLRIIRLLCLISFDIILDNSRCFTGVIEQPPFPSRFPPANLLYRSLPRGKSLCKVVFPHSTCKVFGSDLIKFIYGNTARIKIKACRRRTEKACH